MTECPPTPFVTKKSRPRSEGSRYDGIDFAKIIAKYNGEEEKKEVPPTPVADRKIARPSIRRNEEEEIVLVTPCEYTDGRNTFQVRRVAKERKGKITEGYLLIASDKVGDNEFYQKLKDKTFLEATEDAYFVPLHNVKLLGSRIVIYYNLGKRQYVMFPCAKNW